MPRQENRIVLKRSFVRLCKLDTTAYRVLLHGLTYPTGWMPYKCAHDTGLSLPTVKRAVKRLTDGGYITHVPKRGKKKAWKYRFSDQPSLLDSQRPWYKEMMLANNGDLDGVAIQEPIDDGKWREEE